MEMKAFICFGLFFSSVFLSEEVSGNAYFPRAQDVTWSSYNFKTLLTWGPKPTNYSYTVEFSGVGTDRQRNPHCIRSKETECDLTRMLTDLKETYIADVLSEPELGKTSDLVEQPHTSSGRFCPYKDTVIGRPDFKMEVNEEKGKITLYIEDPLSAIYQGDTLLSMRDIFKNDLKYRVTYRKAGSTGKKLQTTDTNQIELDVDRGESYCFNVQAYIPSRSSGKQLGEMSRPQCSPKKNKSIFEEYGLGVIAGAALAITVIVTVAIALIVVCCRRGRKVTEKTGKEGLSLSTV
ncbi:tissue factor-like [Megalops cyprinoides]|uniref:tissue factor-like n=1 Tax=Megalops cyprinoides TaxID=118141 RepID=UPI0018645B00|nr:tissue factor-like [Megalops cyprinoides]